MWSAWLSQWLVTDNSISHRNTELPPLALSAANARRGGRRCPWQPRGPPLFVPSSAQLVALLKSNDLFHHHLHKAIPFSSRQPTQRRTFYQSAQLPLGSTDVRSSCHQLSMQQYGIKWVIKNTYLSSSNVSTAYLHVTLQVMPHTQLQTHSPVLIGLLHICLNSTGSSTNTAWGEDPQTTRASCLHFAPSQRQLLKHLTFLGVP